MTFYVFFVPSSEDEGEEDVVGDYKDFFLETNKDEKNRGWTFDEYQNSMAQCIVYIKLKSRKMQGILWDRKLEQRRYDRVFYKSDYWIAKELSIFANQKIDTVTYNNDPIDVFISDHFGVLFTFECK